LKETAQDLPTGAADILRGAMYTLNITEVHCVAYRIGAYNSEGMKSENPHAGVYKTDL